MSNRTLLAAELARRIPALQADSVVNNEALIKGLIEQYLGPEFPKPNSFIAGGPSSVFRVSGWTELKPPTNRATSPVADWINNPVPVPAFER